MKLSPKQIILFIQTLVSLLSSGINIQQALSICSQINTDKKLKVLCSRLIENINNGYMLSESLHMTSFSFDNLFLSILKIGETTGNISDVLEKLLNYKKQKEELNNKIIQTLIYPIIVLITAITVISIIILFVFPKLSDIFESFTNNSELIALKLASIKNLIYTTTVCIGIFLVLTIIFIILYKKNKSVKFLIDKTFLSLPVLKKILLNQNISDFCFSMKILLSSGITPEQAIELSIDVIKNDYLRYEVSIINSKILLGTSLSQAFQESSVFPNYFKTWVSLAEYSGNTNKVFVELSNYYENLTNQNISWFTQSIEPLFILITGILIFIMVIQFVLPVFELLGAL